MRHEFIRHGLPRHAGKGFPVIVHQRNHRVSILLCPQTNCTEITGRDNDGAKYFRLMRECLRRDPTAHAVTADDDPIYIDRKATGIFRGSNKCQRRICVFQVLRESKVARAAPRASIIYGNDSPTRAAHRLSEIEILFVAGKTMKEDKRRVWTLP